MPSFVIVPTAWCAEESLTKSQRKYTSVVLVDNVQLRQGSLFETVYANLTIGAVSKRADASDGCPSRIEFTPDVKLPIIVICARVKVSKGVRPSPKQLEGIFNAAGVPTSFGISVFRNMGDRVWSFIERYVHPGNKELSKALAFDDEGNMCWKPHTKEWTLEMDWEDLKNGHSEGLRSYRAPETPSMGKKRVMDAVVKNLATTGVWDHLTGVLKSDAAQSKKNKASQVVEVASAADVAKDSDSLASSVEVESENQTSHAASQVEVPKKSVRKRSKKHVASNNKGVLAKVAGDVEELTARVNTNEKQCSRAFAEVAKAERRTGATTQACLDANLHQMAHIKALEVRKEKESEVASGKE